MDLQDNRDTARVSISNIEVMLRLGPELVPGIRKI
jgi:hypothetical protein